MEARKPTTPTTKARKSTNLADNQGTQINQTCQKRRHTNQVQSSSLYGISGEDTGTHLNKFDIEMDTKITANLKITTFPFNTIIPEDIPTSSETNLYLHNNLYDNLLFPEQFIFDLLSTLALRRRNRMMEHSLYD
jgi:hypothetical protein